MTRIETVDRNFAVHAPAGETVAWMDIEQPPFAVHGLMREDGIYVRMPQRVAETVSDGVAFLNTNTAGGRVRFATDSPNIHIRADLHKVGRMPHFTLCGSAGFDLYEDAGSAHTYKGTFIPPYNDEDSYESTVTVGDGNMRNYTVNFPPYSGVKRLQIGLEAGSHIAPCEAYRAIAPIVYYGSSITQGGCASRPGNTYQAMVCRALNCDYLNLGFSGNAKAEDSISDYIAQLAMSVFVYDYDHNAPTAEYLAATHEKMFLRFRRAQPDTPVIFMCRPQPNPTGDDLLRLKIIETTYENAKRNGDNKVFLLNMHRAVAAFCGDCATVDGSHPNDLGFMAMATAVTDCIQQNKLL